MTHRAAPFDEERPVDLPDTEPTVVVDPEPDPEGAVDVDEEAVVDETDFDVEAVVDETDTGGETGP